MLFNELFVDEDLVRALSDQGITEATPIQEASLEKLLKGHDLIGQSQTGSGKTIAFSIPLIELVDPDDRLPQGIVLCPTRELALQVTEEIRKLLKYKAGIRTVCLYGGEPIQHQISDLRKGAQLLIATPGRLLDHMRRHSIKLSNVQMIVLDEADEMLNMGFKEDIDLILAQLPEIRQTVLYSATMGDDVISIGERFMENPDHVHVGEDQPLTVDTVRQVYFVLKNSEKTAGLERLLRVEEEPRTLVFCNTKKRAAQLAEDLVEDGFGAEALHGDLKQIQRDLVMRRFRQKEFSLLVATDVAARGLDISDIDLVVNYDLPEDEEAYIHRIGRTARAGKSGLAYSFALEKEVPYVKELASFTGAAIEPRRIPSLQDIEEAKRRHLLRDVRQILDSGKEKEGTISPFGRMEKYRSAVEELVKEGYPAEDIACALMTRYLYVPAKTAYAGKRASAISGLAEDDASHQDRLSRAPKRYAKTDEPKIKLYLNVGKRNRMKVRDLLQLFEELAGISRDLMGQIDLLENFSYVQIPSSLAASAIAEIDGKNWKEHRIHLEIAKD
ncbi:MAG: DEAD/DEAH box helicase [Firmicutes bacterium]|nr:DEAD/DEAH box helicase [Bacillota bacterium]